MGRRDLEFSCYEVLPPRSAQKLGAEVPRRVEAVGREAANLERAIEQTRAWIEKAG